MTAIEQIYDFEGSFERPIRDLFASAGITAVTRYEAATELQKVRPRVEILFVTGTEAETFHIIDGIRRNCAWNGTLTIAVITDHDERKETHAAFRSQVRYICSRIRHTLFDDNAMPFHAVNRFVGQQSTYTFDAENGVSTTTIPFAVHFNIRNSVWPENQ